MPALNVQPVAASQPGADYWFTETLSPESVLLPAGVEILPSARAQAPRAFFILKNSTQIALYVMSLGYKDVLVMSTPDANWKARLNGAHEAASYQAVPNGQLTLDVLALSDLDKNLVDRNVLSAGPPPENVPIPAAQTSELLLVYDGQVIEQPFTLTYSLNPYFGNSLPASTPASGQVAPNFGTSPHASVPTEWKSMNGFLVAGLVVIDLMVVSAWLIWKAVRRSR